MKSTFIVLFTAVASLFVLAAASSQCRATYVLTETINQPDPTQFNALRGVLLTDDYLLISARAFSTPGKLGRMLLYDAAGEQLLHTFQDPLYYGFQALDFASSASVDGRHLAAASRSDLPALVHVFDTSSGELRRTITSPIAAHPGFGSGGAQVVGDYIVVGTEAFRVGATGPSYPASIDIFDANTGDLLRTLIRPSDAFGWGGQISVSGNTIAVGSDRPDDGKVFFYDVRTGSQLGTLQNSLVSNFSSMKFQDDKVLLGQTRGSAFLLDTSGNILQTFPSPGVDPQVSGAYFEFCGPNILVGSFGSLAAGTTVAPEARLYDSVSGQLLQTFGDFAPGDRIFSMDSNRSGSEIAILRATYPSFGVQVLVYSVPEPSTQLLALASLCVSMLRSSRRASRSFYLPR